MHHFNYFTALAVAALLLSGCPETASCDEDEQYSATARECVDRIDAGGFVDATTPDAPDFCDTCAATEICDRVNSECDECAPSTIPTTCAAGVCSPTGTCVECNADADCPEVGASQCIANQCEPCSASPGCAHLESTPVCDVARMECVGCLSNDDCGPTEGCDLDARSCRAFTPGNAGLCGACVRDAECAAGMLCAPTTYDDPRTPAVEVVPAGAHCLWRRASTATGAPNGACSIVSPYEVAQLITSADGETDMLCALRHSTCEAHEDFANDCMTVDAAGDARCGREGVEDGVCRMFDAAANRCTVRCATDNDCPSGGMRDCDTTVSPPVCAF